MKKIRFEFADGSVSEVEVEDEIAESYEASIRREETYERKVRYWEKTSLDNCDYEGEWFADPAPNPLERCLIQEQEERNAAFIASLTPVQRRRLLLKMNNDLSNREIAEIEGVKHQCIDETFEQIKKRYLKFFEKS